MCDKPNSLRSLSWKRERHHDLGFTSAVWAALVPAAGENSLHQHPPHAGDRALPKAEAQGNLKLFLTYWKGKERTATIFPCEWKGTPWSQQPLSHPLKCIESRIRAEIFLSWRDGESGGALAQHRCVPKLPGAAPEGSVCLGRPAGMSPGAGTTWGTRQMEMWGCSGVKAHTVPMFWYSPSQSQAGNAAAPATESLQSTCKKHLLYRASHLLNEPVTHLWLQQLKQDFIASQWCQQQGGKRERQVRQAGNQSGKQVFASLLPLLPGK